MQSGCDQQGERLKQRRVRDGYVKETISRLNYYRLAVAYTRPKNCGRIIVSVGQ